MSDDALDLHLSAGEVELLSTARTIGAESLRPIARDRPPGELNRRLVKGLAEHGLLNHLYRRDADGSWSVKASALDLCLIREGLARSCTEAETAFAVQGLGSVPLIQSGDPAVVAPWIELLAAGDAVAGFALTEPQAGSDVAALRLDATAEPGGYRLTGTKTWISNAPDADVYTVFARTTPGGGARGLTAFLVPRDIDGLTGERLRLVAPHAIGSLVFDKAFVPEEYVLGEVDRGFSVAMQTLDLFRPSVGAFAIGMARTALDATVQYVAEREVFGAPLSSQQSVRHKLADLTARVAAARLLVHQAARAYDHGIRPVSHIVAMAKLLATELAPEVVDAAIQFHGARALEQGHELEHLYREVRAPRIYEGASEVQREIIARHLW